MISTHDAGRRSDSKSVKKMRYSLATRGVERRYGSHVIKLNDDEKSRFSSLKTSER
jgi:hypothetical protein